MSQPGGPGDERNEVGHEPVPDDVLERARKAFSQRARGPIARLTHDSMLEKGDAPQSHVLSFAAGEASIQVHVAAAESQSQLDGSVEGFAPNRAMLHLEGSELAMVAPVEEGSFSFDPVAHGVVRLSFETAGNPGLSTDWFQV